MKFAGNSKDTLDHQFIFFNLFHVEWLSFLCSFMLCVVYFCWAQRCNSYLICWTKCPCPLDIVQCEWWYTKRECFFFPSLSATNIHAITGAMLADMLSNFTLFSVIITRTWELRIIRCVVCHKNIFMYVYEMCIETSCNILHSNLIWVLVFASYVAF